MIERADIFVGGRWVPSAGIGTIDVVNPANDQVIGRISRGAPADVDTAVAAARAAQPGWAATPAAERIAVLDRAAAALRERSDELADLISTEMGAPRTFSRMAQIAMPVKDLDAAARAMEQLAAAAEERIGVTVVAQEPIGVVGAITPWNFPLHQIAAKVAPALAAGCTVVLKPSEVAPLNAFGFTEILAASGLPAGVLNLVAGGPDIGAALAGHPGIDMISFTGSTRAGRLVAQAAAPNLAKVTLELGGKSATILLDDVDPAQVVPVALKMCYANTGQACAAKSRLLVPHALVGEVERLAVQAAAGWVVGDPRDPDTTIGPVASRSQQERVQGYIRSGIEQGARLLHGGAETPAGFEHGAYVQPTVFTEVTPQMTIAQEEIFGPVLAIMGYADEDEAVRIANGTAYGLSDGVFSPDRERALRVARRLRSGQVVYNGAPLNVYAPLGGVKHSGLGVEYGRHGLQEYFTPKSLQGFA